MTKKRYVICGISGRGISMWIKSMYAHFKQHAELVGMLDIDPLRFKICKEEVPETACVPEYMPEEFDRMIEETRPDAVIVACRDCFHAQYIIAALEKDLDVISEKPMTHNWEDAVKVCQAEKRSRGKIICTFNYRYYRRHVMVKELLLAGKVGKVTHIDLTWYIDIHHGASYFNRWNRMRENSGSLSIHKACHHFDLVNWYLDFPEPRKVHAFGELNHFGANGPFNPSRKDGRHCRDCAEREDCAYKSRWETRSMVSSLKNADEHMQNFSESKMLYTPSLYRPDKCIFDSEIDIHDTLIANVRYNNGALLNYSANFSTPYEGYHLAINGTHGRIESYFCAGLGSTSFPPVQENYIDCYPIFGSRERYYLRPWQDGEGGGNIIIQEDVFLGPRKNRKYDILANSRDGLYAVAIGDAVYKSIAGDQVIDLHDVVRI